MKSGREEQFSLWIVVISFVSCEDIRFIFMMPAHVMLVWQRFHIKLTVFPAACLFKSNQGQCLDAAESALIFK